MAKVINLESVKEKTKIRIAIRALVPGNTYIFPNSVRSSFVVAGESSPREANFAFNKGVFILYDEQEDLLVFEGEPLNNPGGLGQGLFAVSSEMALYLKEAKKPPKKEG